MHLSPPRRSPSAPLYDSCCSRRCGSSSSAPRSTPSRRRRRRRTAGWRSSRPPIRPALIIRWFGTRYTLRVPGRWVFTAHEVRLAQAIGAVLAARYQAILNPADHRGARRPVPRRDRGSLRRRLPRPAARMRSRRARRVPIAIASIIELLRGGGALELRKPADFHRRAAARDARRSAAVPAGRLSIDGARLHAVAHEHQELLPAGRRRAHGVPRQRRRTPAGHHRHRAMGHAGCRRADACRSPCAKALPAARAAPRCSTATSARCSARRAKSRCSPTAPSSSRSEAPHWHLLDLQAKYRLWAEAVGDDALAMRMFQTALDLADTREGALFVVARDAAEPSSAARGAGRSARHCQIASPVGRTRRRAAICCTCSKDARSPTWIPTCLRRSRRSTARRHGSCRPVAGGGRHPAASAFDDLADGGGVVEGARTTAALAASRFGPVLKVSEDGIITFFDGERVWDI